MNLSSLLLLGFVLGIRHAMDADHVAAVASLSMRASSRRGLLRLAAGWGVGHMASLVALGGIVAALGVALPPALERALEAIVGVMLLALGGDLLWRVYRGRLHVHVHEHDGLRHAHFHTHTHGEGHDRLPHAHEHWFGGMGRAVLVGGVHGLAGSGALLLMAAPATRPAYETVAVLAVFGLGATIGMILFSLAISVPLRAGDKLGGWLARVQGAMAIVTIVIGARIIAG